MRFVFACACAATLFASSGFAAGSKTEQSLKAKSASSSPAIDKIVFTNKLIDGKKVWTPGDVKAHAGAKLEITLVNELADPHGFSARELGLKEDIIVGPHETKTVTVDAPKSGTYKVICHMHPAHVGAKLTVQ